MEYVAECREVVTGMGSRFLEVVVAGVGNIVVTVETWRWIWRLWVEVEKKVIVYVYL